MKTQKAVATLTPEGFLICSACWIRPAIQHKFGQPIAGKHGRVIREGDTYSDEQCDICGQHVTKG